MERYTIAASVLDMMDRFGNISQKDFLKHCIGLNQRVAILSGLKTPESGDKTLFLNHFNQLKKLGYLVLDDQQRFKLSDKIAQLSEKTSILLSEDVKQAIQKLAEKLD